VATVYGWKYKIDECSFPNNTLDTQENLESIYGISFTPPNCETISTTFLSNGIMACSAGILLFGNHQNENDRNNIFRLFAKTQYAGMATHAIIINLFRHLNSKYFADFNMIDEGGVLGNSR
jgi:hypothetical protein